MTGVDVEVEGRVATVRIDRPERRNAMTVAMWRRLADVFGELAADARVRVVILTGAGGTFCAGADVSELASDPDRLVGHAVAAERAVSAFPKPAIAMIEGDCIGGGCELAIACDVRVAGAGARFGVTPARLGMVYPAPSVRAMVALLGPSATKYLLYSGELIDAAHALRIGLVDDIAPPGELGARVRALAAGMAARSSLTQRAAKETIAASSDAEADALVARRLDAARSSGELDEGLRAFRERRPPSFPWNGEDGEA